MILYTFVEKVFKNISGLNDTVLSEANIGFSALVVIFLLTGVSGCSQIPSHSARMATSTELVDARKWAKIPLLTDEFKLHGYRSPGLQSPVDDLHVYIEGDDFAWRTRTQPSSDPTPFDPLALKLALRDPSSSVVYLSRPCKFSAINDPNCSTDYWTNKRFSPEVIETYQEVLNKLVHEFKIKTLTLIGYSGGGTIAALLSDRRNDVRRLITIAGNLDTDY